MSVERFSEESSPLTQDPGKQAFRGKREESGSGTAGNLEKSCMLVGVLLVGAKNAYANLSHPATNHYSRLKEFPWEAPFSLDHLSIGQH